ncbi:MAG: type II toxin-antitoxin system RelE/ParE family toxin [Haliea sp.]
MKQITAHFFATEAGKEPVRDWLVKLGDPDKRTIGEDLKAVEFGWPRNYHPPTLVKNLDGPIWEVRSYVSDKRIARVLFAVLGSKMLLLHGLIKKTQKTPKPDLDLARDRLKQYQRGDTDGT